MHVLGLIVVSLWCGWAAAFQSKWLQKIHCTFTMVIKPRSPPPTAHSFHNYVNVIQLSHPKNYRNVILVGEMKFDNETAQITREVIDKVAPDLVFTDIEDYELGLTPNPKGTGVIITDATRRRVIAGPTTTPEDKSSLDLLIRFYNDQVWPLIEYCQGNGIPVLVMSRNNTAKLNFAQELLRQGVDLEADRDAFYAEVRQLEKEAIGEDALKDLRPVNSADGLSHAMNKFPTLLSKRKFMEELTKIYQRHKPAYYYLEIEYQSDHIVKTIMAHDFKNLVTVMDMCHLEQVEAQLVERHGFKTLSQPASTGL